MFIENNRFLDRLSHTFKRNKTRAEPVTLENTTNPAQDSDHAINVTSLRIARAVIPLANPDSIHNSEISEIMPPLDQVVGELKEEFANNQVSRCARLPHPLSFA